MTYQSKMIFCRTPVVNLDLAIQLSIPTLLEARRLGGGCGGWHGLGGGDNDETCR